MKKSFSQDKLTTGEGQRINSLILEQASDNAEKLTELECKLNNIECTIADEDDENSIRYTDEAQDIFNIYYDKQVTELYSLLNAQLKVIK